ncbi:caspase family protein [bacterium]|nr:caspase family protein [bacterium]
MHLKKYTDAIDCFSKSIKEEELSGSFGGRGESYYFLGAYYKALEDFEKAKKLNKGEGYTYWLAMTNLALRDYSKAVNIFGKNPHLGVSISNHESGIRINQVRKNGPAMHAGLQENDIILTMNGIKHKDVSGFITQVSGFAYGSEVPFIIERDGLKYKGTFWAGLASDLEKKYENLPKLVLIDSNPEKVVATKDKPEKTTEKPEIITEKPVRLKASFGEYYALVIGNNNYKYIPKLKTAINDAKSIADLLKNKYGFNVQLVTDAGRSDVLAALNNYRKSLTKNDNLFIFYAGHGWLDQQADRGYWLPVDAEQDSNINWISNASITDAIRAIQAKHIMLVADSCYSGKLTRGINLTSRDPGYIEKLINKKSRTVLTSGGLEPVDDSGGGDHSVFTNSFLNVLTENEDVLDGHLLFSRIRRPILLNSDQTPEYSDIRKVGHDGGDFLFIPKNMK